MAAPVTSDSSDDETPVAAAPVAKAFDDDDGDNLPEKPVDKESDLAKKTRAELADLDDLDI
jgi:hypothetical protein